MPEMAGMPAIERLLRHAGSMLLLDRVLDYGDDFIHCGLQVRADGLFDSEGAVPALVGLEYMAQTVAAFSGLQSWRRGEPPRLGFLLGTRKFTTNVAEFPCGAGLVCGARRVVQASDGMAAFDCLVEGDGVMQSATLTAYEPADARQFLRGQDRA